MSVPEALESKIKEILTKRGPKIAYQFVNRLERLEADDTVDNYSNRLKAAEETNRTITKIIEQK